MDTSTVVMELLHRDVIDEGDQKRIAMEHNPNTRNQILYACLMKKCTNDALKTVCDVMIGVPGNPKMAALGYVMKNRLEMGKWSACISVCRQPCIVQTLLVLLLRNNRHCVSLWISNICEVVKSFSGSILSSMSIGLFTQDPHQNAH